MSALARKCKQLLVDQRRKCTAAQKHLDNHLWVQASGLVEVKDVLHMMCNIAALQGQRSIWTCALHAFRQDMLVVGQQLESLLTAA